MNETEIRKIFAKPNEKHKPGQRGRVTPQLKSHVRGKTAGACHICGGPLGKRWQVDHVVPRARGGKPSFDNYLPICHECNRLRWSYPPSMVRLMIRFGIYAKNEIRHDTELGKQLIDLALRRDHRNHKRRKGSKTLA